MSKQRTLKISIVALTLAACGGPQPPMRAPGAMPQDQYSRVQHSREPRATGKIDHVIIVIQESRSFDNLFATFPGADGATYGCAKTSDGSASLPRETLSHDSDASNCPTGDTMIKLEAHNLTNGLDLQHCHAAFETDYDNGNMDGFYLEGTGPCTNATPPPSKTYSYQYVIPARITPYWDIAKQWVLADHLFQTQGSGTFTAHQALIAGDTQISRSEALIGDPTAFPWGCGSSGLVQVITRNGSTLPGVPPCFTYQTLRDLLDANSLSWKYYTEKDGIFDAFSAIKTVRYGSEWKRNVTRTNREFFEDVSSNKLPAVSWVVPTLAESDYDQRVDTGPAWVASIVNAVGESSYWKSSAIVIVWSNWGGFYDHVAPPRQNWQGGPGFRVPMIVVSPYAKQGVDHTIYVFGSILKFIEENWNLGSLGRDDVHVASIRNAFDFQQPPRRFKRIPSN